MILYLIGDSSTQLGARIRNWKYPATDIQLLTLKAVAGDDKVMPWPDEKAEVSDEEMEDLKAFFAQNSAIQH